MLKSKERILSFCGLLLLVLCWHLSAYAIDVKNLTILYTNDLHGHILPSEDHRTPGEPKPVMGGSAYLAGYVKGVRSQAESEGRGFLLLDGGDIFHGTPEGNDSKGRAVIKVMNTLGYDAMVIGNHDYVFGQDNLKGLSKLAKFPFLGANITQGKTGKGVDYARPFIIKVIGGIKVGIIGVTTTSTPRMNFPEDVKGLVFSEPDPVIARFISLLEGKGVDLIIILSHLGYRGNKKITESSQDIDLIIGGHSHQILEPPLLEGPNQTIICEGGDHGLRVGHLELRIDLEGNKILDYENRIVNLSHSLVQPDPEMDKLVGGLQIPGMDEVIGYARKSLRRERRGESLLGDWITDVMREKTGADIAFLSGGSIRGDLKKGEITLRDVYCITPFLNTLVTLELSGGEINGVLERSVADEWGASLQVSGLKMVYDPERPDGAKLIEVKVNDEPIDHKKRYRIVTTNYEAYVKEKYPEIISAKNKQDTSVTLFTAEVEYIKKHSPISSGARDRMREWVQPQTIRGKVDINNADLGELKTLPGIGQIKAERIIEYRKTHGPFKSIEEIKEVKSIGPKLFERLKEMIGVNVEGSENR